MSCTKLIAIGLHMASYHTDAPTNARYGPEYNNTNPGAYVATECGLVVGSYYNSVRSPTFYVGYNHDWKLTKKVGGFVSVAAATGYELPVTPMVMTGLWAERKGYRLRLGYIPKAGKMNDTHVFHLMIEKRF